MNYGFLNKGFGKTIFRKCSKVGISNLDGVVPALSFLKRNMQIKKNNLAKRKFCNINLDCDLIKQIEIMATHLDKRQNELIEEAIQDLLKKYKDLDRPAEPSSTELFLIKTPTKNT